MTPPDAGPIGWLLATADELPGEDSGVDPWLSAAEQSHLATLRFPRRRADWRLGRWTAKRALAIRLGLPWRPRNATRLEIRARPGGAPEALLDDLPAPAEIAISHRAGAALAAVAPAGTAVGCDLERIEPRSEAFVHDYLAAAEQAWVGAAEDDDSPLRANLMWSCKESVLKVLGVGLRRDLREIEITVPAAPDAGGAGGASDGGGGDLWLPFTARIARPGSAAGVAGWWRRDGDLLLTVASVPPAAVPSDLRLRLANGAASIEA